MSGTFAIGTLYKVTFPCRENRILSTPVPNLAVFDAYSIPAWSLFGTEIEAVLEILESFPG